LASGPGDRLAAAVDSASSFGREHFTDTGIYRLDTATNTFECAMAGHPDLAKCLAWSPDGGLIASGTGGFYGGLGAPIVGLTPVPLWRVEDGRMISSFVSETESIDKLAWHPSSAILATSHDRDETVRLWSIPERRMIFEISVPQPKSVYALSFHPTNGHLVWGRAGAVDVFEIRGLG
jgi:WD40 repeat protein